MYDTVLLVVCAPRNGQSISYRRLFVGITAYRIRIINYGREVTEMEQSRAEMGTTKISKFGQCTYFGMVGKGICYSVSWKFFRFTWASTPTSTIVSTALLRKLHRLFRIILVSGRRLSKPHLNISRTCGVRPTSASTRPDFQSTLTSSLCLNNGLLGVEWAFFKASHSIPLSRTWS